MKRFLKGFGIGLLAVVAIVLIMCFCPYVMLAIGLVLLGIAAIVVIVYFFKAYCEFWSDVRNHIKNN
jgi:phosphatidylglycerophosphate synthase